ncbi:HEAT repeat-containing protein 3 [Acropora cervicornis]|uniref:HEAT repeat-containing protein 3 n=1 Tax=Acropora cervicornis TaxID=6130 RepID=A0AAD9Q8V7_ACRCE|nr:HEAT repeat-containing protein 3 [Acropora cervicornis]
MMGKTRAKKRRCFRKIPTGLPSVKEAQKEAQENSSLSAKTLPLLEKLTSTTSSERECACAGLANLVFERGAIPTLLNQDIVRRLGPLLIDSDRGIQEGAAGTLRNLSVAGGPEVCEKMVEQDVMTPLSTFVRQSLDALGAMNESLRNSKIQRQAASLAIQAVSLLWNLCENCSTAVNIFNCQGLLPCLVSCLESDVYPTTVAIPAAQCLHTVTEDNASAAQLLCGSSDLMKVLEKSLMADGTTSDMLMLKVLTAGVLYNIRYAIPVCSFNELLQAVVKVLAQVLDVNCFDVISKLLPEPTKVEEVQMLLNAQQLALEILSNMCCPDDTKDDEWEDCGSVDSMDEEVEEEVAFDINMVLHKSHFGEASVYEALRANEEGAKLLETNIRETGESPGRVNTVQARALICLNNIVSALDTGLLGGQEVLAQLWTSLFSLTFESKVALFVIRGEDFLEAASGVLRSVMEKVSSIPEPQCITAEHVTTLCRVTADTTCEAIKVKLISILGYIGKMAAKKDNTQEILKVLYILFMQIGILRRLNTLMKCLGTVFLDIANGQFSLWVICEALDAIFDTFADGPLVSAVADSIGLLVNLQQLVQVLRSRMKNEKRTLREHYPVVDAARVNLTRFIKYKMKGH